MPYPDLCDELVICSSNVSTPCDDPPSSHPKTLEVACKEIFAELGVPFLKRPSSLQVIVHALGATCCSPEGAVLRIERPPNGEAVFNLGGGKSFNLFFNFSFSSVNLFRALF